MKSVYSYSSFLVVILWYYCKNVPLFYCTQPRGGVLLSQEVHDPLLDLALPLVLFLCSSQSMGEEEEGIPMRPLRIMNGDPERRANLVIKE